MKKMFFLISFLFLLLFTYSFKPALFDLFKLDNLIFSNEEYYIYCLNICNDLTNCEIINNGNGYIIKTDINNAKLVKSKVSNILGESVRFKSTINKANDIIDFYNLKIIKEEKIEDILCIYGYCENNDFNNSILIDNNKVNLQVAFSNGYMTIGTPIILGDY